MRVRHGHGRLVAAALHREDQRAGRGNALAGLVAARCGHDGPGADGRARRRVTVRVGSEVCKRQPGAHDARVMALAVIVGPHAHLGKAQALIEMLGRLVAHLDLKNGTRGAKHLGVIGHAREQPAGYALVTAPLGNGHIGDL